MKYMHWRQPLARTSALFVHQGTLTVFEAVAIIVEVVVVSGTSVDDSDVSIWVEVMVVRIVEAVITVAEDVRVSVSVADEMSIAVDDDTTVESTVALLVIDTSSVLVVYADRYDISVVPDVLGIIVVVSVRSAVVCSLIPYAAQALLYAAILSLQACVA